MQWLPGEETTVVLGALTALGFLALGVIDLAWPPRRARHARRRQRRVVAVRLAAAPAPRPGRFEPPRTPPVLDNARRATHSLGIGRALLDRAVGDTTLSAERRLMLLQSAVVWLTRGLQFAPEDEALRAAIARSREAVWSTFQDIALARLAAETPWGTSAAAADAALAVAGLRRGA